MKINSSSKIIYENLTPYIMRNSSEINTNSNSPIKVRKKVDSLIKVNSAETFKLIKISNQSKQKVLKYKIKSINFNVFIRKNLFKYNSYPFYFYIKISNQLLLNFPNHLVSIFKDNLIWNENYDYFKNIYSLEKSNELLPKIGNYYETYTLFTPNYFPLREFNSILSKYIKNKIKFLEITDNENDDLMEKEKDVDKSIIDNIKKNEIKENNEKKEIFDSESNNNKDKKLINTTDIKSENSISVSNYFGLDSVIKCKDNSNYGIINNFENQIINFPLLNEIKQVNKNKKNDKAFNPDFSFELASIIQSFEENEKKYVKKIKTTKTKSCDIKKTKIFKNNKLVTKLTKYDSNSNYNNKRQKNYSKTNKKLNSYLESKYQIKNPHLKIESNKNKFVLPKKEKRNINLYKKNKIKNKSNDVCRHLQHLTFNIENYNNLTNKINYQNINTESNSNNIYNTYVSNKNNTKICTFLYKNQKNLISTKVKKMNNYEPKKIVYKKVIAKSKESMASKISKNINKKKVCKRKVNKRNNLTLNFLNKINSNKNNDYVKLNTTSSLNIKRSRNNSRNRNSNNFSRSRSQRYCIKKHFSNSNLNKIIFVNKKTENNNSTCDKKNTNNKNSFTSYKDYNTLNSIQTINKICVNKKESLAKSIKKENKINTPKNKSYLNIQQINNLVKKKSLNHYKSFIETEYNTLLPKLILKKMFFNKIKNEKISNKASNKNKYSSLKKHNISSKNNQNTCSSIDSNTKIKPNYHKYIEIKIPKTYPIKKSAYENKKISTQYNSLMKIVPKTEIHSPTKAGNQLKFKNMAKVSAFPINEKSPNSKKKDNLLKNKNYTDKKNNIKINKTIQEINKIKINNNLKKKLGKNSFMVDTNTYNNDKISPESKISTIKKKKKEILNDSLKSTYINKNKIRCLIKNSKLNKKNSNKQKTQYQIINPKTNTIKFNTYSIDSTGLSKRDKIKNFNLK